MISNEELWKIALGEIELAVSQANFKTWFKNTTLERADEHVIKIYAPNIFTREWLENKYHQVIFEALKRVDTEIAGVTYEVAKAYMPNSKPFNGSTIMITKKSTLAPVVPLNEVKNTNDGYDEDSNLNVRYTFDSFVIGANNELAFAACQAVARKPGKNYNPLFIYGGVGLGKTHLLQATGNAIARENKKVRYLTSEKFTNEMISAIGSRSTSNFKSKYREIDVLIIDDVQFLAGKEKTQEEFFHTFNELYGLSKQIIISSDRPPKAIPTLEERLRSRFEGGMIADIGAPDLETRIAILDKKCEQRGVLVPREVLQYISTHVASNIRELEGALNRVLAVSELNKTQITLESAKNVLSSVISEPKKRVVHTDKIVEAVCGYFHIDNKDLFGKCRRKEIVRPRQIAMYLLRKDNGTSFPTIGASFGGRDHTTAMHACEKIEEDLENDEILKQDITIIRQKLYA